MAFTNEARNCTVWYGNLESISEIPEAEISSWQPTLGWEELTRHPVMTMYEKRAKKLIAWMKEHGKRGIVLAGRPYHVDPEIHHGIPDLITSYGIAVLTEDSVSHLHQLERPI